MTMRIDPAGASAAMQREPVSSGEPIRVVVFGGAFFEPYALEFIARLDAHPDIELAGVVCQSTGFGITHAVADVVRRRGALAFPVLLIQGVQTLLRFARAPRSMLRVRRRVAGVLDRALTVPKIHAPEVLDHVRLLAPDLGLIYGAPILKPELFEIPRYGTLGIHQGKLPFYRGKKTTFWAMYNGEETAGVAIQKINAGLDTGAILRSGEVPIGRKRYGRVDAEVQKLGVDLYIDAILAVRSGTAQYTPQPPGSAPLYRQPGATAILHLWRRQLSGGRRRS